MTTCLDLHALYGDRFKLRLEADGATSRTTPDAEFVWLWEMPCRYGVVYAHGGDILAATITGRRIGQQVAALPCILSSRGDIERVVLFHVNDAEAVLSLLKPRRRRLISPEYQARLAAIGRSTRFSGAQDVKTGGTIDATTEGGPIPSPEVADAKSPPGTESGPSRLGEAPAHAGGAGELAEGQDMFAERIANKIAAMLESRLGTERGADLVNVEQAAMIIGVPASWLAGEARRGTFRSYKRGHYRRYDPREVVEDFKKLTDSGESS